MERWKSLEHLGFSNYLVSDHGRVMNERTNKIMKTSSIKGTYVKVGLIDDSTRQQVIVHVSRLVAEEFLPPPHNSGYNAVINVNGDRTNNHVDNLMWAPRWYALRYHKQFRHPYYNYNQYPVRDIDTGIVYPSAQIAGIATRTIAFDIINSVVTGQDTYLTHRRFERV